MSDAMGTEVTRQWVGNILLVFGPNDTISMLTCFANRIELRGDGWDKRKTRRNPFPDGRVIKVGSLREARHFAEIIADVLTEPPRADTT